MTRVEELTLKLLDGDLTEPEAEELRQLLARDEEAVKVHVKLLEIEGGLRGERDNLDLGQKVVDRIGLLREKRIENGVMDQIQALGPRPQRITHRRTTVTLRGSGFSPWGLAGLAAAACLLILFAALSEPRKDPPPHRISAHPVQKPQPPIVVPEKPPSPPDNVPAPTPPRPDPVPPPPPTPPAPPPTPPEKPAPPPAPAPEKPAPPAKREDPPKARPAETVVALAEIETMTGDVRILMNDIPSPAVFESKIRRGDALETVGPNSSAVLRLPDGTRVRLSENGLIRGFEESNRIVVSRGVVTADVARQSAGKSVTFATPQAEVKVLGTKLLLHVLPTWTRLEVQEGKVRLSRMENAAGGIEVAAGQFALAAPGVKLSARPLPAAGAVAGFALINTDNGLPIAGYDPIPDNAVLNLATLPTKKLNIRAYAASGAVGSIRFELDDPTVARAENSPPFDLASDVGRNLFVWPPTPGTHVLTATAFTGPNATGTAGGAWALTFRVVDRK